MVEQQQNNKGKQVTTQQTTQQSNTYYQQQPMQGQNSGLSFTPQQAQQYTQQQQAMQQYQQIPGIGQQPSRQPIIQQTMPTPTSQKKEFGKGIFGIGIGAAVVLIVIISIVYFMFFGKQAAALGSLMIDDFKFCNSVDDNFNCDANVNGTFKAGDDVWFVLKVYGHTNEKVENKYNVQVVESITTLDPYYQSVSSMTGTIQTIQEEYPIKSNSLMLKTKFQTTVVYPPGQYTINLIIEDKLGKKTTSIIREFTIE